jgi:hypothetical protein
MTSQTATRRRLRSGAFLTGSLIALASFASFAATPARAQVDPGFLPVTGTWTRGDVDTVAWIDLASWKLVTSTEGGNPSAEPQPVPWLPVAGDWDGDGVDSVQMFNIHDWRVVPAERGPVGESEGPEPQPWIPVAGDWDGDGIDTVLVFDQRDETLHRLEEGPIPVERYDPQPQPWWPEAGDWSGVGFDTVATYRNEATTPASAPIWRTVFGDWDGDGIDSAAALHMPTGELVQSGSGVEASVAASHVSATFAEALQFGCWVTIKNKVTATFTVPFPSKCTYETSSWEKWTCCLNPSTGKVNCSMKMEHSVKQNC